MTKRKTKRTTAYPPLYRYNIQKMMRYGVVRGLVLSAFPAAGLIFFVVSSYVLWFRGESEFSGAG